MQQHNTANATFFALLQGLCKETLRGRKFNKIDMLYNSLVVYAKRQLNKTLLPGL